MITVRNYKHIEVELYAPDDTLVGLIKNEIELNDVRIQVAQEKAEGYYIMFEDKRINILPEGSCDKWPIGFFDKNLEQMSTLIRIRRGEPHNYNLYN